MALTSGERKSKSTVSSIQSRMGVVDTYSGKDALGLAAEGASAVLDVFAERQANIEEVSWKTDFKLKSREKLNVLAREHYDDPDAFTKATNTYRDTLIAEAPNRFKNYAKEYIGNLAFEYGDNIWQEAKAQKTILEVTNWSTNYKDFIASRNSDIMNKPASDFQDYWTQSLLPEMSDTMADYEKLYNSYDSSIQASLQKTFGTPEEFNKALQLGFETQRLISLAAKDLNAAQAMDTAFIQQMGGIPENYETEVSKVLKQYQQWGANYLDKPNHDTDDASVFIGTNREDRAGIITSVEKYIDSWNKVNEKNVEKQDIILSQNKEEVVIDTIAQIEDGFTKSIEEIRVIANQNNLSQDQLDRLIDVNTLTLQVQDVAKSISTYSKTESGAYKVNANMSEFDVNQLIFNRTKYLNDLGVEITQQELKDKAMMQQMFSIISSTPEFDNNITQSVFNNMDLGTVVASGATENNVVTNSLVEMSKI
jgi:DNA-binding transcriptional regulator YiaG